MRGSAGNSVLAVGLVLLVLGAGNWVVSANKIAEYTRRTQATHDRSYQASLADFPRLTPSLNRKLLKRLNRGYTDYGFVGAKLDFYRVTESGGRMLFFGGLLLITAGLVQLWRRGAA